MSSHGYPIDEIMQIILSAECQTDPMPGKNYCTQRHAYCMALALAEAGYSVPRLEEVYSSLSTILEDTGD